jgi:hypothetical protein
MVCDGEQGVPAWLAVAPDGDFQGANVQSGKKGRYLARVDRHPVLPPGRLAAKLIEKFVSTYGAVDTSV